MEQEIRSMQLPKGHESQKHRTIPGHGEFCSPLNPWIAQYWAAECCSIEKSLDNGDVVGQEIGAAALWLP